MKRVIFVVAVILLALPLVAQPAPPGPPPPPRLEDLKAQGFSDGEIQNIKTDLEASSKTNQALDAQEQAADDRYKALLEQDPADRTALEVAQGERIDLKVKRERERLTLSRKWLQLYGPQRFSKLTQTVPSVRPPRRGPGGPPPQGDGLPPGLATQGFTDAELKAIEAELKAQRESFKAADDRQKPLDEKLSKLSEDPNTDPAALEKALREALAGQLDRDLSKAAQEAQWRKRLGDEKTNALKKALAPPPRGPEAGPAKKG